MAVPRKMRTFATLATEGAQASSFFILFKTMIDKNLVKDIVERHLDGSDLFLVDINISPDNRIEVEIDSANAVDIDACIALSRAIEDSLDRDVEDFELEVGSAGLTSPFKVKAQYDKNIGNEVEVITNDGRKLSGTLVETSDSGFVVETVRKVRPEGAKRPVLQSFPEKFAFGDVKSVKYVINFK